MQIRIVALVAMSLALACGQEKAVDKPEMQPRAVPAPAPETKAEATKQPVAEVPVQPEAAAAPTPPADGRPAVEVQIGASGTTMKFDVTAITASAGQSIHLVLNNKPPGQLPHNWVLVRPGTEAKVAAAGLAKGQAAGYLELSPDVLAHTDMIMPGKTAEITFSAPAEPGKYPYICTFPGHYMMMKGVLTVTP